MTLVFLWACVIVTANIIHPRAFDVPYLAFWLSTISLEFMGGMLIAFCLRSNCLRLSNVMAILILAVVIFPGLYAGSKLGRNQDVQIAHATTRISVYALPALTTVWVVLQMEVQNRWKWIKQLAWLGDRSYSTYLIHVPMLAAIFLGASRWLKDPGTLGLILFTLLVLAFIMIPIECFYRFIEKPSHRLAKHWASSFTATRRP
jgi:peptidoglycan/LPS O-acetylase OafA/YrhL